MRAVIPVNLRPLDKAARLGNFFGLVFLALPVGIANPLERVYEVRRRMNELKESYQPILALGLLGTVGMGPNMLQQPLLDMLSNKASAVMTNVPGPREAIYLGGARMCRDDVLGAAIRPDWHGRQHSQLQQPGAFRPGGRPEAGRRSRGDH